KDNNQIGATQTVNYGGNATAPTAPAVTGYTFAGWDKSYSNVTEDLVVTATYTINTYTVKFFDKDNNQIGTTQTINYGGNATAPAVPAITGYTFAGWDKSYSNVTEDLIVTATYTINTYTVTFKNWNGDVLKTQSVAYGSAATEPTVPARAGYTFTGWDADFSNVTGDVVATATFSTNAYSVTFKDWNGDVLKSQNVAYGNSATAPATPTRTGYTFAGWDKAFSNVTEDLIVTATYTINTYTVTFKNWNGDVLSTQTVDYGAGATEPTVPAREGYEFIGWDKIFNNVMSDMIIIAQYEELSTPVTPSITVPDNATQTVALNENIEDIIFEVDNTNADISVTGLPDGVTYEQLGNTVVISGKPTESGTFTYVVKAEADGLASTKESVIIVEEQPENPTSVDETALNYSWKQTQNSVALEGVNVKIMTLYSESGARIKTVRGSNEINTSELVYGSRFIVVAIVEGKSNPIANKFIK
ncbi:MAG: InlB B-repeat-containing protein, partial [Paludibacteraceae bacterium]|nr:InlB B-repeat-containing protein [Paludibacteraceae bacterium]